MKKEENVKYKTKNRTEEEKKNICIHLNRITGQIGGIKKMIESDRYCGDVLIQVAAVNQSLKSVAKQLLKQHLETCVVEDIKQGNIETIDEVMDLFNKLS